VTRNPGGATPEFYCSPVVLLCLLVGVPAGPGHYFYCGALVIPGDLEAGFSCIHPEGCSPAGVLLPATG